MTSYAKYPAGKICLGLPSQGESKPGCPAKWLSRCLNSDQALVSTCRALPLLCLSSQVTLARPQSLLGGVLDSKRLFIITINMNVREYGSVQQPMLTCFRSRKHGYRIQRLTVVRESQQSECELPCYISSVTNRYQSPPMEVGHAENSNECYKLASFPYYVKTDLDQGRSTCTPPTLCLEFSGQVITKRHSDVIVPTCTCNPQLLSYAPGLALVQGPRGISTNAVSYLFLSPAPSASSSTNESRRRERRIVFISI